MSRHIVCLTFDFDAQSGFISRGLTTPTSLSRGEFGIVGAARILELLKSHDIRSTWFIPGFTIETYPAVCEAVAHAGHEVAHHSWAHIAPANQTREQEEEDMIRANDAIKKLVGTSARGYRSPAWDHGVNTIELLLAHGFQYDSSLMGGDYRPYRARLGDVVELGKPLGFGQETSLIEMPISWTLDDHPHFEFMRLPNLVMPGLQSPRTVLQGWLDEFLYMKKSVEWGVLTYTMHPYVIGRGFRMLHLEELVARLVKEGAVFMTLQEAAEEAQSHLVPRNNLAASF
jgi:peptidoglycan/xylan/chitin deacetylase (PgdA/CDA1 family)